MTLALASTGRPARASGETRLVGLILALAACAIRIPHFGDPAYMIDEQFYLLVGERMLHGALPYVDIWDRKPIGLFLIYALSAACGGVWAYQILATACATATAFVITRIARPVAGEGAAVFAGLLYLLWIEIAEGGGGQAPVFYNLAVAGAALAVLRAGDTTEQRRFDRFAVAAMALVGIAIQIKYTVLVEGLFFGLVLGWWTLRRLPWPAAVIRIVLLASIALAPTLLAFGCYAAMGEARAFWFANFVSIFGRAPTPAVEMHYRIGMVAIRLLPLAICVAAGLVHLRHDRSAATSRWRLVAIGWCAAAVAGLFSVGTLYSHYILPAFVPFVAASAPIFARRPSGPVLALFAAALPALTIHWPEFERTRHHRQEMAALVALIPAGVAEGCMEMFDGPPALYRLTDACTVTRFPFPDHLSAALEARAIGVDPAAEVRRLLARRPLAITIADQDVRAPNRETFAIMRAALTRFYRLAGSAPHDGRRIEVWVRR